MAPWKTLCSHQSDSQDNKISGKYRSHRPENEESTDVCPYNQVNSVGPSRYKAPQLLQWGIGGAIHIHVHVGLGALNLMIFHYVGIN